MQMPVSVSQHVGQGETLGGAVKGLECHAKEFGLSLEDDREPPLNGL